MVEATMKWVSVTQEFGFVNPHDGSRDVIVPFYSGENSRGVRIEHLDGSLLNDLDAPTVQRGAGVELHCLASIIEVRARYPVSRDSGRRVSQ